MANFIKILALTKNECYQMENRDEQIREFCSDSGWAFSEKVRKAQKTSNMIAFYSTVRYNGFKEQHGRRIAR